MGLHLFRSTLLFLVINTVRQECTYFCCWTFQMGAKRSTKPLSSLLIAYSGSQHTIALLLCYLDRLVNLVFLLGCFSIKGLAVCRWVFGLKQSESEVNQLWRFCCMILGVTGLTWRSWPKTIHGIAFFFFNCEQLPDRSPICRFVPSYVCVGFLLQNSRWAS